MSWPSHALRRCPAVLWMRVGRAVGWCVTGMLNHVRPRTASASTQQARQRAGAWRFVRCFSGFESQCFSAREHPREVVGQLIRHPRRLRVFHASRAHVHPPHVAVCVPLSRLRAHLRPYPTTAHPTRHPSRGPPERGRCVGLCRCAPRRPRTSGRWFRPLVCVGGRCLSQATPKCAPIHRT